MINYKEAFGVASGFNPVESIGMRNTVLGQSFAIASIGESGLDAAPEIGPAPSADRSFNM